MLNGLPKSHRRSVSGPKSWRRLGACAAILTVALWFNAAAAAATEVSFSEYSPLASNLELARRLLPPLTSEQIPARLSTMGKGLREQAIDLRSEKFSVYVPANMPSGGYGLLVFIPPWQDGHMPPGWASTLDRLGFVFVSAIKSGNEESVLGRREPLAILAAYNAMQRYRIDRSRVFISGFSGGSRVAMRLAIAYPDLFRGAFLDAGSDPVGASQTPLPPRDIFERFREESAVFYASGSLDGVHLTQNAASLGSMRRWCVPNLASRTIEGLGHEPAPSGVLSDALTALTAAHHPPSHASQECWRQTIATMDALLSEVATLVQRGDTPKAGKLLSHINERYGGLAAPQIGELARTLAATDIPDPKPVRPEHPNKEEVVQRESR